MDVNIINSFFGTEGSFSGVNTSSGSTVGYVEKMESFFKEMGIAYDEEKFAEMRSFAESVDKMMADRKTAQKATKEEILELKKKIVENMIKTMRMLNSRIYTKDSWKGSMAEVAKAAKIFANKDLTSAQLNTAMRHLRRAMSKLEPALKDDEKGLESERKKALSGQGKIIKDGVEYELGSVLGMVSTEGSVSVSISTEGSGASVGAEVAAGEV